MVAAQRGHDVTLFERQEQLGGQVRWLAKVGAYREYAGIVDWLEDQVRRAGVDVRLGEMASSHQLTNGAFDAAIVATGSTPLRTGWSALHPHRWGETQRFRAPTSGMCSRSRMYWPGTSTSHDQCSSSTTWAGAKLRLLPSSWQTKGTLSR